MRYRLGGRHIGFAAAVLMLVPAVAQAAEEGFPFDTELLLDVRPMKGSKRVPMLEIGPNGQASIDLWCNTVTGQLVVVEGGLTILTGPKTERQCAPERMRGDEQMLSDLMQVTSWRRSGEALILEGGKPLRFIPAMN